MEYIDYKPLGTIIKIHGIKKRFMIVQRATVTSLKDGDTKRFFDYGCVLYPEGLIKNQLIYIQDTDIEDVIFVGYTDQENTDALDRLKGIMKKINMERVNTEELRVSFLNQEHKTQNNESLM